MHASHIYHAPSGCTQLDLGGGSRITVSPPTSIASSSLRSFAFVSTLSAVSLERRRNLKGVGRDDVVVDLTAHPDAEEVVCATPAIWSDVEHSPRYVDGERRLL